jgi:uncharacterized protein (DUF885 family)
MWEKLKLELQDKMYDGMSDQEVANYINKMRAFPELHEGDIKQARVDVAKSKEK